MFGIASSARPSETAEESSGVAQGNTVTTGIGPGLSQLAMNNEGSQRSPTYAHGTKSLVSPTANSQLQQNSPFKHLQQTDPQQQSPQFERREEQMLTAPFFGGGTAKRMEQKSGGSMSTND